jgi:hypothetical protein
MGAVYAVAIAGRAADPIREDCTLVEVPNSGFGNA